MTALVVENVSDIHFKVYKSLFPWQDDKQHTENTFKTLNLCVLIFAVYSDTLGYKLSFLIYC